MKNAKTQVKKHFKIHSKFGMYLIGFLVSSLTWQEVCDRMSHICTLLTSEFDTQLTKESFKFIDKELTKIHKGSKSEESDNDFQSVFSQFSNTDRAGASEVEQFVDNDILIMDDIKNDDPAYYKQIYHEILNSGKPFVTLLERELQTAQYLIDIDNQSRKIAVSPNKYQSNAFYNAIVKHIIPCIHLYSGLFLGNVAAKYGREKLNDPKSAYYEANKNYENIKFYGDHFRSIMKDNRTQGIVEQAMHTYKYVNKKAEDRFSNPSDYCVHFANTVRSEIIEYGLGLMKSKIKDVKTGAETSVKFKEPIEKWSKRWHKDQLSPFGRYLGQPTPDSAKNKTPKQISLMKHPSSILKEETIEEKIESDKTKRTVRRQLNFKSNDLEINHFGIENKRNNCWLNATVQALGMSNLLQWYLDNSAHHNLEWLNKLAEIYIELSNEQRTDSFRQKGKFLSSQ
jgi:hypothetical protein